MTSFHMVPASTTEECGASGQFLRVSSDWVTQFLWTRWTRQAALAGRSISRAMRSIQDTSPLSLRRISHVRSQGATDGDAGR